uniref:Uncharacterized protein n=1 Tax=Glossina palpalis gambiensis TaxID=67801 RepID=A0A1B0BAU9_9MUSC
MPGTTDAPVTQHAIKENTTEPFRAQNNSKSILFNIVRKVKAMKENPEPSKNFVFGLAPVPNTNKLQGNVVSSLNITFSTSPSLLPSISLMPLFIIMFTLFSINKRRTRSPISFPKLALKGAIKLEPKQTTFDVSFTSARSLETITMRPVNPCWRSVSTHTPPAGPPPNITKVQQLSGSRLTISLSRNESSPGKSSISPVLMLKQAPCHGQRTRPSPTTPLKAKIQ